MSTRQYYLCSACGERKRQQLKIIRRALTIAAVVLIVVAVRFQLPWLAGVLAGIAIAGIEMGFILDAIERFRRSFIPGAEPDRLEQLRRLAELRESGVLTDAEFAAEKAKLLGSSG